MLSLYKQYLNILTNLAINQKYLMFGLGTKEIIIIAVVLVLLFGSKKIPELAKSLVDAIRHLRGAFKEGNELADDKNKKK